jgi:adenylate kinase family enzyme
MRNTIIINLFAGPGSGKSTGAAYIFSKLKMLGIETELVTEFAKDLVWEENSVAIGCSPYVFGNQLFRIEKCLGKVDVVITDSPILLSTIYDSTGSKYFQPLVLDLFSKFQNRSYFIKRVKKYNPNGRLHTETEANQKSEEILSLLENNMISYKTVVGDIEGYEIIIEDILKEIGR